MLVSLAWVKSAPDRRARCVDLDPEVIAWAKEHNIAKEPRPVRGRFDIVCGSVLDIPFENATQDVVMMTQVLHHLTPDTHETALSEIVRVLKP
eukprot:COSAG02_NODE_22424_length_753_cov_1.019878_2_plen_92_part_01